MGIFGKNKGKSYSFDYSIQVHSLRPWPATGGPLFISWQRGSAKRGNTAPVNPTTTPGVASAEYRFEDRLSISATLYSVRIYLACLQPDGYTKLLHHFSTALTVLCMHLAGGVQGQR